MKKRFLCIFLAVMMMLCTVPFSVLAYNHTATAPLPGGVYKTWKQTDPRWSGQVIGIDPWTDAGGVRHDEETMGHAGCLISSMAILARGYGLLLQDGTEIDPGTLGRMLYDDGSCRYLTYQGGARYSTAFHELIPGITFDSFWQGDDPIAAIVRLLSDPAAEYVIIAGVNGFTHYVAVDYVEGETVYICDPGYPRATLAEYTVSGLLIFRVDEQYVDPGMTIPGEPVWRVIEPDGVRIRNGAGLNYERLGVYPFGTVLDILETTEADGYLWGKTVDGWCALRTLDGTEVYCERKESTQYSVTYHTNGGSEPPEAQLKSAGEPLTLSEMVPVKEGYRFLGWSADPSALSAQYAPGAVYQEDAAIVLYAVWMSEADIFGFGIDVSSHQGEVDWQAVAADGVEFVILRAGTSRGKDTRFEENYQGAKEAGLHIGSYMYSYALTPAEALEDAALFTEWLSGKTFDMPVFLDLESREQSQLSVEELTSIATTFQTVLERAGYYCGVYSSESWFGRHLLPDMLGGREYLWVAKWTASGTLSQNMSVQYAMYQYSETGRVAGIDVTVDLDVCYVNFPQLLANHPWVENPAVSPLPDSGLKICGDVLYGGRIQMTVLEWQQLFDGETVFWSADGAELAADAIVTTGCKVSCGERLYLVGVQGDLNGDGEITAADYVMLKRGVLGVIPLSGAAYYAGCLSGEQLRPADYIRLKRHVLGILNLYGIPPAV